MKRAPTDYAQARAAHMVRRCYSAGENSRHMQIVKDAIFALTFEGRVKAKLSLRLRLGKFNGDHLYRMLIDPTQAEDTWR